MMNTKRDRSSADESPQLCLLCSATIPDDENQDREKSCVYAIILDPNLQAADSDIITDDDGFILNSQPTVRFDGIYDGGGVLVAYCVSKSTLYIIESDCHSPSEKFYENMRGKGPRGFFEIEECARRFHQIGKSARLDMIAAIPVTKTVYSFDLARSQSSSSEMVVVKKSELQKLPDMHGGKLHAEAVVTPDGKILVFSTSIPHDLGDSPQIVEAELYDPDIGVWSKLPPLYDPIHNHDHQKLLIFGYGFLTSSVFFVSTANHGNYIVDLQKHEKCWQKHEVLPQVSNKMYFIGEEGVGLTEHAVKSTRDWGTLGEYPAFSSFPDYIVYGHGNFRDINRQRLLALVGNVEGGGCYDFCTIKVMHHIEGGLFLIIPFFIVDLFCVKKISDNKFITSKDRCLKFSPRELGRLFTLGLFSLALELLCFGSHCKSNL